MKKLGRPRFVLDIQKFEAMCKIHCNQAEISGIFDIDVDTLERAVFDHYGRHFSEVFADKSSGGKMSLRHRMFQAAMSGNPTMLIWLSKNWLGMRDRVEVFEKETLYPSLLEDDNKSTESNT